MEPPESIQVAAQGDLNAFNKLVLKYQDQVFNLAYRFLRNQDAGEDIFQSQVFSFTRQFQLNIPSINISVL